MSNRLVLGLAAYLSLCAAIAAGIVSGVVKAGYPLWAGGVLAFLVFLFLNGSLAYKAKVRKQRAEGKEPPKYFQYIFFPQGRPKFKEAAPRSTHFLVGIASAITGAFFVFCGVALALDGQWSRISKPCIAAAICIVLAGIGVAFLYLAWRLLAFGKKAPTNVA